MSEGKNINGYMNRIIGLVFGVLLLAFSASDIMAQEDVENVPLPKSLMARDGSPLAERKVKFVVGGNVGFGVSYSQLNMQLSPHFGICPGIDFICIGIGGTYHLNYYKSYDGVKNFTHIFGARAFVEGYAWDRLVIHAEYEWLSFPGGIEGRQNTNGVLVGAGYKQKLSDHFSVYGLFLFPVYDELNVYSIMEIKVGVNYKF